jgi:hypothetical protein
MRFFFSAFGNLSRFSLSAVVPAVVPADFLFLLFFPASPIPDSLNLAGRLTWYSQKMTQPVSAGLFENETACRHRVLAAGTYLDLENQSFTETDWDLLHVVLTDVETARAVTRLSVENSDVDESGALRLGDILKSNTTLIDLNIAGNKIGLGGARMLVVGLNNNMYLTSLLLGGNNLGDQGLEALAHAHCVALRTLDLQRNDIGVPGAIALSSFLRVC